MNLMINLMPKDEKFYDEIDELASLVANASKNLCHLTRDFSAADTSTKEITEIDRHADGLAQQALERLDRAFITPLDREDILHLITDLYAVVETINAFARRVQLYRMKDIDQDLAEQVEILAKVTGCLEEVMRQLRKDHRLRTLNGQLKELHELERSADEKRNAFLGRLFEGEPDPLDVMKKKELHDLLETGIGNCENVSRTLQRVVLKNS
jgi:uncharacterized protein Yka (UPF0111/DUF47 family)